MSDKSHAFLPPEMVYQTSITHHRLSFACQALLKSLHLTRDHSPRDSIMRYTELAERPRTRYYPPRLPGLDAPSARQAFHHPRTSLGAAGHWIHLAAVAAPLVIGEVIKDPDKRWRALRLASVGAALISEGLWTHRLSKERKHDEEDRAALESCYGQCR